MCVKVHGGPCTIQIFKKCNTRFKPWCWSCTSSTMWPHLIDTLLFYLHVASKQNMAGKSREELTLEKQQELERRLMDVSGQLNSGKKPPKSKREWSSSLELKPPRGPTAQLHSAALSCTLSDISLYMCLSAACFQCVDINKSLSDDYFHLPSQWTLQCSSHVLDGLCVSFLSRETCDRHQHPAVTPQRQQLLLGLLFIVLFLLILRHKRIRLRLRSGRFPTSEASREGPLLSRSQTQWTEL